MMLQVQAYTMLDRLHVHVSVYEPVFATGELGWAAWRNADVPVPDDFLGASYSDQVALLAETILDICYRS